MESDGQKMPTYKRQSGLKELIIRKYNDALHSRIRIAELAGLKTGLA
jgi:hypothetical protein